jgi:hypothetical protein
VPTPSECPVCGHSVPRKASSCPNCGADERTGWDEDAATYDGLDLPESAFDDDASGNRAKKRPLRRGPHPIWLIIGIGLLVWFVILALSP